MIASECMSYQHLFHIHILDPQSHSFLLCFITSAIDSISRCDKKGVSLGGGQARGLSGRSEKSCRLFVFSAYDLSCTEQIVHGAAGLTSSAASSRHFKQDVTGKLMESDATAYMLSPSLQHMLPTVICNLNCLSSTKR